MAVLIAVSLGLIVVGLVMLSLYQKAPGILSQVTFWAGVLVLVCGLLLLLVNPLAWLAHTLKDALGV